MDVSRRAFFLRCLPRNSERKGISRSFLNLMVKYCAEVDQMDFPRVVANVDKGDILAQIEGERDLRKSVSEGLVKPTSSHFYIGQTGAAEDMRLVS